MLKYTEAQVTFAEFPDEVSLCIDISGCPNHCPGCHSPELWEDVGDELNPTTVIKLINQNKGISCIGFMGGDQAPEEVNDLASNVRVLFPDLKIGWYSGRQSVPDQVDCKNFDYIKLGPYIQEKGPLNNPNTNQRMLLVKHSNIEFKPCILEDITDKFWKNG